MCEVTMALQKGLVIEPGYGLINVQVSFITFFLWGLCALIHQDLWHMVFICSIQCFFLNQFVLDGKKKSESKSH